MGYHVQVASRYNYASYSVPRHDSGQISLHTADTNESKTFLFQQTLDIHLALLNKLQLFAHSSDFLLIALDNNICCTVIISGDHLDLHVAKQLKHYTHHKQQLSTQVTKANSGIQYLSVANGLGAGRRMSCANTLVMYS